MSPSGHDRRGHVIPTGIDLIDHKLAAAGCNPKRSGSRLNSRCPAHDDTNPSLSVSIGTAQPVVIKCHAGCPPADVLAALDLTWADVCAPNGDRPNGLGELVDTYVYVDEDNLPLYRVLRFVGPRGKTFRQQRSEQGAWANGLAETRRVLYRLPELLAAVAAGETVWITEGEKDVDRLRSQGVTATCNPMGAGRWADEYSAVLADAKVMIVADRDQPGARHALDIALSLSIAGGSSIVVQAATGKDASDHLAAGHGLDEFVQLTDAELLAQAEPEHQDDNGDEWSPPAPLGRASHDLPTFPVDALPKWTREFVVALAEAMQVPVDLPAVLALAVLATAAGGRAVVEIREGFTEPTNLYTAVAMEPGERKSPVFKRVTAPLVDAEQTAIEAAVSDIAEGEARHKAALAAAAKAQQEADNASEDAAEEAILFAANARLMAEAITVPAVPRLLADDATPEALTTLLAEQGGRLAILSDEGDIFNQMAGRYSKTENFAVYLKGHAGSPLRVDRKGRPPEHIKAPALTLGLAVQPEVLRKVAELPGARGLGLLGRFLWAIPTSNMGHRKIGAAPVPTDIADHYDTEILLLVKSLAEWTDPAVLPFTPAANDRLEAFETVLEPRLGPHGDLAHIKDWASKLAGHTARIAGLLHLAGNVRTGWGQPVQAESVDAAITIADYFVGHALAVFDLMGTDPAIADARHVADWLKGRDPFTKRDAYIAHRSRFPKAADLDPVLELLEAHEYIRPQPQPESGRQGGRRPSPTYDVNPLIP